jgi:hypothetical protein
MYGCLGHDVGVQTIAEVNRIDVITSQIKWLAHALKRGPITVSPGSKESTGASHTILDRCT